MSTVHRGWDLALQRPVAIKLYQPNQDEAAKRRFEEEARTLGALSHPGLVAVYDSGDDGDQLYLVMQLIDGPNLRDRLADGPLPAHQVRALGARLAEILAYVHAQGVIHRDVKPSNVLLDDDGGPYLADFGISRSVDGPRLTATGQFVGTAGYLAPEQVLGGEVGPEADVYALGLVLLECLTGQAEYTGSDVEMAVARLNRAPRIPGHIPLDLASAIGAMTVLEPQRRPTSAECAEYLRDTLASPAPANRTIAAVSPLRSPGTRRPASHGSRRPPGRHRRLGDITAEPPAGGSPARRRLALASAAAVTLLAGGLGWAALTAGTAPQRMSVDSAPPASLVAPMPSWQPPVSPSSATSTQDTAPAVVAPAANPAPQRPSAPEPKAKGKDRKPSDPGHGSGHG